MRLWYVLAVVLLVQGFFLIRAEDDEDDDDDDYDDKAWEAYKRKYNKTYGSEEEEEEARDCFEENQHNHFIHNLNDDEHGYSQDVHEHSDKPAHVAKNILCGTDKPANVDNRMRTNFIATRQSIPESVNWVNEGIVTSVKNQGSCGSCWAFTAAQAVESQYAKKTGSPVDMSPQYLVDCASSYGNSGCDGGWPDNAFEFLMAKGGEVKESNYPYKEADGRCKSVSKYTRFPVADYVDVGPSGDENAVASALAKNGPLAIAIYVPDQMMSYSSGIFSYKDCQHDVNHGVVLVGYGTDNGQDYWLIKNSWGPNWGENGYIRMARNSNNMCHVASYASYPVIN